MCDKHAEALSRILLLLRRLGQEEYACHLLLTIPRIGAQYVAHGAPGAPPSSSSSARPTEGTAWRPTEVTGWQVPMVLPPKASSPLSRPSLIPKPKASSLSLAPLSFYLSLAPLSCHPRQVRSLGSLAPAKASSSACCVYFLPQGTFVGMLQCCVCFLPQGMLHLLTGTSILLRAHVI